MKRKAGFCSAFMFMANCHLSGSAPIGTCCAAEEDMQRFLDALDAKKIASKSIWRDHGPAEGYFSAT